MQALCLSAPRSGSTSLAQALQILGYTPFAGMAHNYFRDNRFALWDEAISARSTTTPFSRADFEKFLGPYDAVSGWSAAILAEDLVKAYPDAKVVLATREPGEWERSWRETVVATERWWRRWRWILPVCGGLEREFRRNAETSFDAWSGADPFDGERQRGVYVAHNEKVRALVPEERLLEMDFKGDWGALCRFLGTDVPKEPYPHGARREGFQVAMAMVWRRALFRALRRLAMGFGVGGVVLVLLWRPQGNPLRLIFG